MDKQIAAQAIRERLEKRLAIIFKCERSELPRLKIGSCVHFLFLLEGCDQTLGGFDTSMHALITLLGHEIVWADPNKAEVDNEKPELPKVVVN